MNLFDFTAEETIPYLGLTAAVIVILILNYKNGFREFWSPLTVIAIIFGYYCVIGPYEAISSGKTFDRLTNMRPYYLPAFWGAFISFISCVIGFNFNRSKGKQKPVIPDDEVLGEYGKKLSIIGFVLFTISTGGSVLSLINPLNAGPVENFGGSFRNYLSTSLNFLIPGVTLLFAYFLRTKKGFWWFVGFFVIATALFTTLAFRYRLVLLLGSMAIVYYMNARKRPNLIFASVGIFLFIALMGIINITRSYGRGLNLSKLETSKSKLSYYQSGLVEARIFQTSGAIIDMVPARHPYAGFAPITSALLFPIPSSIYKEKNSAEYLFNALDAIYGKKLSKGAAFLMFGEHYLAFGWIGIIIGGFLIGWFYKKLWVWFQANSNNPVVVVVYAVTISYAYVIISRGYLPQVTMLFFFSVYPIYFVSGLISKRYRDPKRILSRAV